MDFSQFLSSLQHFYLKFTWLSRLSMCDACSAFLSSLFDYPSDIWWKVYNFKLFFLQFSPDSSYIFFSYAQLKSVDIFSKKTTQIRKTPILNIHTYQTKSEALNETQLHMTKTYFYIAYICNAQAL